MDSSSLATDLADSTSRDSEMTAGRGKERSLFDQPLPPAGFDLLRLAGKAKVPGLQHDVGYVLKSGWLTRVPQKHTGLRALLDGKQEPRWVVLTPTALAYFTNENRTTLVRRIPLHQCIVGEMLDGVFRVKTRDGTKDFQASDPAVMATWVAAIRAACILNRYISANVFARQRIDPRLTYFVAAINTTDTLHLDGQRLGDLTLQAAGQLIRFSKATALSLEGTSGDDAQAAIIAALVKAHRGVHRINLRDNVIRDAGAESLAAALSANMTLRSLDLSNNKLTIVGADYFIRALQTNATIQEVILTGNPLTSTDASISVVEVLAAEPRIKFQATECDEDVDPSQ